MNSREMPSMLSTTARARRRLSSLDTSHVDNLDPIALIQLFQGMRIDVDFLKLENGVIERYLQKNDPELLLGVTNILRKPRQQTKIHFASEATVGSAGASATNEMQMRTKRIDTDTISVATTATNISQSARSTISLGFNTRVNYTMRIELSEHDILSVYDAIEQIRVETRDKLRRVITAFQEVKLTNSETVETQKEFGNFVLCHKHNGGGDLGGEETNNMQAPLERFTKFIDKWTKNGSAVVEKMRLRSASLKQQIKQLQQVMALKKELSGILRPIDFEQMATEKLQNQQLLDKKLQHLIGLKRTTGDVLLTLSVHRKHLAKSQELLIMMDTKIDRAKSEWERLANLSEQISNDINVWRERIARLKNRQMNSVSPSIEDYMESKKKLRALTSELSTTKRVQNGVGSKLLCVRQKKHRLQLQEQLKAKQKLLAAQQFEKLRGSVKL